MQLSIHAVGRMKSGPERDLVARYAGRIDAAAGPLGLAFSGITERAESAARDAAQRKREEARDLIAHLDAVPGGVLVLLDETGRTPGSEAFAHWIARMRDDGRRRAVFAIGGADGHDAALKERAALVLSFGALTWPHQLVRVMLAEQIYRAMTILSGHPYHRA